MNTIAISVTLSLDAEHPADALIDFNLTVDGEYLHEIGVFVDPVDLTLSAASNGEFFIFTCDCGNPACLGIVHGVRVSHSADTVRWLVHLPISPPPDEPEPAWARDVEFSFDRTEYIHQISQALEQSKILARNYRCTGSLWVGPDLTVEGLLALEIPNVDGRFSMEGPATAVQ